MKLHGCLLAALAVCAPLVRAQYFSDGWQPGQPTTQASNAAPTGGFDPAASQAAAAAEGGPASTQGNFLERVLTSGPFASFFAKTGVNITERLEAAHAAQAAMWDQRIPLITDENYNDLIVNETFASEEEERARVWFIVMCVPTVSYTSEHGLTADPALRRHRASQCRSTLTRSSKAPTMSQWPRVTCRTSASVASTI